MLLYLHGFNSSPQSHKARVLGRYMESLGRASDYACPELPYSPKAAIAHIEKLMSSQSAPVSLVGSSLGGYYATYLGEKHGCRSALINPAVDPQIGLRAYLGPQKNLYTGEPYELTSGHLRELEDLWCAHPTPERYLLIVETGDEVLDYRRALARYAGAEQIVVPGGDHSLKSFPQHLSRILGFAG